MRPPPAEHVRAVREVWAAELGIPEEVARSHVVGNPSPLDASLIEGILRAAGDPEESLGQWIREGAPLGVNSPIPSNKVFPAVGIEGDTVEAERLQALSAAKSGGNYVSFEANPEDAQLEVDRYIERRFFVRGREAEGIPMLTTSRMALIIKEREDGSRKRRLIIDMRRSGLNARARVPQRVVLPRLRDVMVMLADILEGGEPDPGADEDVELIVADFSDAYCHLRAAEAEWPHLWGQAFGDPILFVALCFGHIATPLIWSRLAAALTRMAQALLPPSRGRIQTYLDDPLLALRGSRQERDGRLAMVLLTWTAVGAARSWKKGARGSQVQWIGVQIGWNWDGSDFFIPHAKTLELAEELEALIAGPVAKLADLRRVTGRNSWATSLLRHARWAVARFWAVLADKERESAVARTPGTAKRKRANGGTMDALVHTVRLVAAAGWLAAFWRGLGGPLVRHFGRQKEARARLEIATDASPWGVGGLVVVNGAVAGWFSDTLSPADEERLGFLIGAPDGQCTWEALALLLGIKLWGAWARDGEVDLRVRSDNVATLSLAVKFASSSWTMNALGAELAQLLDNWNIEGLVAEHIPGSLNTIADALSRRGEGKDVPDCCRLAKQYTAPKRDEKLLPLWRFTAAGQGGREAARGGAGGRAPRRARQR